MWKTTKWLALIAFSIILALLSSQPPIASEHPPFSHTEIEQEMMGIAAFCLDLYSQMENAPGFEGLLCLPTTEESLSVAERIAEMEYAVVRPDGDMYNHEAVYHFYEAVLCGSDAELGIYLVQNNLIRLGFMTKDGKVHYTVDHLCFDEDFTPYISSDEGYSTLEVFQITEKGYLLWGQNRMPQGKFVFRYGLRVEPLGAEKRALEQKYLEPLGGYAGHNALTMDWNVDNLSALNFNEIFEPLYNYESGSNFAEDFMEPYNFDGVVYMQAIPRKLFEDIVTKYFPISVDSLREATVYSPDNGVYAGEAMWLQYYYNPQWEVVDIFANTDGSLTLVVDAVSTPHGKDKVATNYLTVMPREDDSFYYLSNTFERFYEDCEKVNLWPYFHEYGARIK